MTRGAHGLLKWVHCVAVGALVGLGACANNGPSIPNAGPILTADTQRLLASPAFIAFADGAQLDQTHRIIVARTLALHFENDASIQVTAKDPKAQGSMHTQLLGDTVAHLRIQIPSTSWDAFTRSGLLPDVAPEGSNTRRSL